jgi:hypothetical protein
MKHSWRWWPALLFLASCDFATRPVMLFDAEEIPERLSDWQLLIVDGDKLHLNDRVVPYDLNTPLFSDYALKLRTVWIPPRTSAKYSDDREFDFPVGTIFSFPMYGTQNKMRRSSSRPVNY